VQYGVIPSEKGGSNLKKASFLNNFQEMAGVLQHGE
jgi:hypothetical protein